MCIRDSIKTVRYSHVQMLIGQAGHAAAAGGAGQHAHLHQVRLTDVFQRDALLAQCSGQRFETDRAAVVHLDDGAQQAAIEFVQTQLVDVHPLAGRNGGLFVDGALALHHGKVAGAFQQAVGDTRRAAGAAGQFQRTFVGDGHAQNTRTAGDDAPQLLGLSLIHIYNARNRHAALLPAGKFKRAFLQQLVGKADESSSLLHAAVDLSFVQPHVARAVGDVLGAGLLKQLVLRVLHDQAHLEAERPQVGPLLPHVLAVDEEMCIRDSSCTGLPLSIRWMNTTAVRFLQRTQTIISSPL